MHHRHSSGPGLVDTANALSTLALSTIHAGITAVQVIVNRAVWGDCPPAYGHYPHHRDEHCCTYRNVRFDHHHHHHSC